ncbi:hypothetical protein D6829_02595 [Candidatus Pacearchaeota archaeon]|nr:MAG: hypothetical protein D6829_02595 [Candidatus Pacearchaeota archaeon]
MKRIILCAVVLVFFVAAIGFAQSPAPTLELKEGKNNFTVNEFFYPQYASDFVAKHPEIQTITLKEFGRSYGYVNVFGGIGTNFLIEAGKEYEVYVSKPVNITLQN